MLHIIPEIGGLAYLHETIFADLRLCQRANLKLYSESSEGRPTDFTQFNVAYSTLADKLRPMAYSLGFPK